MIIQIAESEYSNFLKVIESLKNSMEIFETGILKFRGLISFETKVRVLMNYYREYSGKKDTSHLYGKSMVASPSGKPVIQLITRRFIDLFLTDNDMEMCDNRCAIIVYADISKTIDQVELSQFIMKNSKEIISLRQIYFLLQKQYIGQEGVLLTDMGSDNLFYAYDKNGSLKEITVYWDRYSEAEKIGYNKDGWGIVVKDIPNHLNNPNDREGRVFFPLSL